MMRCCDLAVVRARRALRTVAQSPQNRHASCHRCPLLSTTLRIRRLDGATRGCTLSSLADDQHVRYRKRGASVVTMTHDAIGHQVAARRHPGGHLGSLHKRTELGILEHEIGAHDCAIGSVARRRGSVVEASDGLLQRALDAVRTDDKIRIQHLATRERDARAPNDGRIGLNAANGGAEADAHARCGAGEAMEHGVVVRAMDVVVRGAVIASHAVSPARVAHAHARVVPAKDDRGGLDAVRAQRGAEPPAEQEARRVGRDLDPRADVAQLACRLEQRDAVPGVRERVRRREPADSCADDDHVQAEGGAAPAVEGRDFLEGDFCGCFRWRAWVVLHCGDEREEKECGVTGAMRFCPRCLFEDWGRVFIPSDLIWTRPPHVGSLLSVYCHP